MGGTSRELTLKNVPCEAPPIISLTFSKTVRSGDSGRPFSYLSNHTAFLYLIERIKEPFQKASRKGHSISP